MTFQGVCGGTSLSHSRCGSMRSLAEAWRDRSMCVSGVLGCGQTEHMWLNAHTFCWGVRRLLTHETSDLCAQLLD